MRDLGIDLEVFECALARPTVIDGVSRRVCLIHKNAPGVISSITGILTSASLNIENMVNKSRKDVAYTMLDVTGPVQPSLKQQLAAIEEAIRVRVL